MHLNKERNPYFILVGTIVIGMGISMLQLETPAASSAQKEELCFTFLEGDSERERLEIENLRQQRLSQNQEQHPEVTGHFYEAIQTITNPDDLLVFVNKNYRLSPTYQPTDLTRPEVRTASGQTNQDLYLREEVSHQLERMFQAALSEGVHLIAKSGYRSYETQAALYQRYVQLNGVEYANRISAKPGHSEHQTGLAIDLASMENHQQLNQSFAQTTEGKWLAQHAHEYGFILRYPTGRESDTGYAYEPWHFRYVGEEVASLLNAQNWILEDYVLIYQR